MVSPTAAPLTARFPALAAFRHRGFARYWFGMLLSLSGVWMRIMVVGWLVNDLTRDPRMLGLVSFAVAFPVLLLSPVAGVVSDRIDRRTILIASQSLAGLIIGALALLTWLDLIRVWHLFVASACAGAVAAFDWPTRLSFVPRLVPREDLGNAVALNTAAFNGAGLIGPSIGGVLLPLIGPAGCFAVGALAFAPITIVLLTLRPLNAQERGARGSWLGNLLDGFRYVARNRVIGALLLLELVPLVFGLTYNTLLPAYAQGFADGLGLPSARVLGWLMAAAALGAFTGVISVAGGFGKRARGRAMLIAVLIFGPALIAFAQAPWLPLAVGLVAAVGLADAIYITLNGTLVQTHVDDAYRGRVTAFYSLLFGLTPIGSLQAGEVARHLGVPTTITINGLIVLGFVVVVALTRRYLWHLK